MAMLVCSPSKLNLEAKPNRLSLKKVKLYNEKVLDVLPEKRRSLPEREPVKEDVSEEKEEEKIEFDLNCNEEDSFLCLGLPNCGNTCYLNSIVQVLRFTPNFMPKIHTVLSSYKQLEKVMNEKISSDESEEHGIFFYRLHLLYMTMQKQEAFLKRNVGVDMSAFLLQNLESFLSSLRDISCSFEEGEQHDAHELLLTIISTFKAFCDVMKEDISNYLNKSQTSLSSENPISDKILDGSPNRERGIRLGLKRKRKIQKYMKKTTLTFSFGEDIASDLGFEGTMRHVIKCLECEKRSEMTEFFTNIEVSIADDHIVEGAVDLRECLEQRTVLDGDNKYFCEECYHKNEAVSSYDIVTPPSILLLHCSWLRQSSNMTDVEKDTTKILIPLFLKTSENPSIFCCESEEVYSLYAVVLHLGCSSEGGHYVAFIKNASKSPGMAEVMSAYQDYFSNNCCATDEILNYKLFTSAVNDWLLFDDDDVSTIYVDETLDIFPYFEYLGITASPCMIFYFKI